MQVLPNHPSVVVTPFSTHDEVRVADGSPEATERICSFLGHPKACPHGAPIPPGPCCAVAVRSAAND